VAVSVAVVDPLPIFQQGVAAILAAAGHAVEAPDDVVAWVRPGRLCVVVLTLCSGDDWEVLQRLHSTFPDQVVIALMDDESAGSGVRAVRAGARSVLHRGVPAAVLRRTVEATIEGQAVMPADVARALMAHAASDAAGPISVSVDELSWLRLLAAGSTVARVARDVGYSERAMFRLLQSLYKKMGVRTRIQAIVYAQEQGWLTSGSGAR
jgi:DNA-binding NarL/FixJ family response regulator